MLVKEFQTLFCLTLAGKEEALDLGKTQHTIIGMEASKIRLSRSVRRILGGDIIRP